MAARSAVELDFFRMERECAAKPLPDKLFDRRRSFRDIQSLISKMNPELLKTVIASGSVDQSSKSSENGNLLASKTSFSVPATPKNDENLFPAWPLYTPAFRSDNCGSAQSTPESAPLTIFYNGSVVVFDVPRHKAENILKFAEGGISKTVESANPDLLESFKGDLPLARGKSLQRFLEKRKERLTGGLSPYGCPTHYAFSGKNSSGYEG